jgi:hypothetical protein
VVVVLAAVLKLHVGVHRSGFMAGGSIKVLAAIDVIHRLVAELLVVGVVVGNAAVLEFGHGGWASKGGLMTCRVGRWSASEEGALLRLAVGYFR